MTALPTFPRAVVVLANYARFNPGQVITNPCVYSRMFLWCRSGTGTITVNRQKHRMGPDDFFFLPWRHSIKYTADREHPFELAGIHLVPDHAAGREVNYEVAHSIRHPLAGLGWRRDLRLPGLQGVVAGSLNRYPALAELADYIVQVYRRHAHKDDRMMRLAGLFLQELYEAVTLPGGAMAGWPVTLRNLAAYIDAHLADALALADLAGAAGCSTATVGRLFRNHAGCSPVAWITQVRMERARLLLSTTGMRIEEVGAGVGIPDPYYFSKLFKKHNGVAPRGYRQKAQMI